MIGKKVNSGRMAVGKDFTSHPMGLLKFDSRAHQSDVRLAMLINNG